MSAVPRRASVTAGSVLIAGRNDLTDSCVYPRLNAIPFSDLAERSFSSGLIENAPFRDLLAFIRQQNNGSADRLRNRAILYRINAVRGMQQPVIQLDLWRR